ncbi:MAG: BtuF-related (seleno)protein, partial [Dehalococcoidia bacterium]
MRICSLLPSGTEILYALGLEDHIIGVTDLCTYPPEVRSKPIVSRSKIDTAVMSSDQVEAMMRQLQETGESPYDLDVAWLQEQCPDVVLTQDLCYFCEVDATTVNRAVQTMIEQPQVLVLNPRTLAEIFDTIRQV